MCVIVLDETGTTARLFAGFSEGVALWGDHMDEAKLYGCTEWALPTALRIARMGYPCTVMSWSDGCRHALRRLAA